MLVINRQPGAKIYIRTQSGEEIIVTALGNNEFGLSLGFEADRSILIDREEKVAIDRKFNENFGNK